MVRVVAALALVLVASLVSLAHSQSQQQHANNSKPQLLSYEQQQDLLAQLAALQRQTQQLLAAQQSLAAVAAAAAANNPQAASVAADINRVAASSPQQHQQHQQHQSSASLRTFVKPAQLRSSATTTTTTAKPVIVEENVSSGGSSPALPAGPQINWGKCPELEPTETEKLAKAGVITKCLESTPLPSNITRESVESHREQIAACALRAEGWFTGAGGYDFGKAEKEIKNKHLNKDLESQVLSYHSQCKAESEEKYPASSSSIIAQIQLYQACMDYFISDVCGIEVNEPEGGAGQAGPGQFQ